MKKSEFDVMNTILSSREEITQRVLADKTGVSLGGINSLIKDMISSGWIDTEYSITAEGYKALEPYKVRNAIIMAAGMSSRFAPLSFENPKALLKVKGEVLIEREIRQLQERGINDITVVVGYMKDKLFYLEDKFGVKIEVNDDYYRYNNTSTLMKVIDLLDNTYICSSDNFFTENVFEPYVYRAYYSAVYAEGDTKEWCLDYDKKDRITNVSEKGGKDSWYMLGHVYFSRDFSEKFRSILCKEYANQVTKDNLWEDLYLRYIKELDMYIKRYAPGVINEFDSLDELREFDSSYINNTNSAIFKNICSVLGCEEKDISGITPIKGGLTNTSFRFECSGSEYVYRHPGKGTEDFINRDAEAKAMEVAKVLKLDETYIHMDEKEGWKISHFITKARELDYHKESEVNQALSMLKKLHSSGEKFDYVFDIWKQIEDFKQILIRNDRFNEDISGIYEGLQYIRNKGKLDCGDKVLCHNDSYSPNFIVDTDNKVYLIDWEYSGMSDPGTDVGTFIACSDYSMEQAEHVIETYLGHRPSSSELIHYIGYVATAAFYWFVWAVYQDIQGNNVGDWLLIWYRYSKQYINRAKTLIEKED